MNKLRFRLLTILTFLSFTGFAQENIDTIRIKEVIITDEALFNPEQAGMQIITTDSIILQNKQGSALSELLSENTPVYIKSYAHNSIATASFRGTAASHTRVEWNGLPVNSPMLGMVDFSLIPVYLIDELSLYEGSSSVSQSSGGLGGAIELKNKADWNNRFSFEYSQSFGSFHNDQEYCKTEFGTRKFQLKTRIYRTSALNDFTFINKSIGDIDPLTGNIVHPLDTNTNGAFFSKGLMQELYWQTNTKNLLSIQYWGQYSERSLPRISSYEGSDNNAENTQKEKSHRIAFSWKHFGNNHKSEYLAAYENISVLYLLENYVPGLGIIPVNNSGSKSMRFAQNLNHERSLNETTKYSFQLRHQWMEVNSTDTITLQGYHKNLNNISIKNAFTRELGKKIHLAFILRSEVHGEKLKPIIPFLGLDYKPSDSLPLVIKISAASNYHFPELNDLYWSPGGNPDLLPEHGITVESGVHYIFSKNNFSFEPSINLWRSNIKNWIIWLPSVQGYWEPQNISTVETKGVELNLQSRYTLKSLSLYANINYSYGSSINLGDTNIWGADSYGKQLSFIPKQSANALLQITWKKFSINYAYNHYSERYTSSSNEPGRRFVFYPYFMNNISLSKKFSYKNMTASAEIKINNLFNETYHSLLIQPMPGRNYMLFLKIKYKLPCKD